VFKYEFSSALLFRSGSHSRVFPFTVDENGCFVYTGNRKQAQKHYPKVILSGKEYFIHRLILAASGGDKRPQSQILKGLGLASPHAKYRAS